MVGGGGAEKEMFSFCFSFLFFPWLFRRGLFIGCEKVGGTPGGRGETGGGWRVEGGLLWSRSY